MTKDKRRSVVCLSAWNCCQDSQLSWPLLPRLQLHVAGKTWAETAHCTGLRYAAMLWFLGVNFLWIRTSLDISGHLWTSLDLWILRLAASWLRVGQVAGRDGTPQKLGPHLVRSLRGLPHTAKDKSCQEKRSKTKYHEMWELWERHVNCKCEPIHCDSSGLFL